jgi:hypothetical protein
MLSEPIPQTVPDSWFTDYAQHYSMMSLRDYIAARSEGRPLTEISFSESL